MAPASQVKAWNKNVAYRAIHVRLRNDTRRFKTAQNRASGKRHLSGGEAPRYTCVCGLFAPCPRSSADRAEDFSTTDPAPTSHCLQG